MPNDNTRVNLPETAKWEIGIYQLAVNDLAEGGPDGIMNQQAKEFANRTLYLKNLCEQLAASIPGTEQFDTILKQIAALDVTKLGKRTDHLERIVGDLMLSLDAAATYPDSDAIAVENFDNPDQVDLTEVKVTSVVSGDDSVDVEDSSDIVIGANYVLTDGEQYETVRVKSINTAGSVHRLIMENNVANQYLSGNAKLYRSSVAIIDGKAYGGGTSKTNSWTPGETFSGSTTSQAMSSTVNFSNASDFIIEGATIENGSLVMGSSVIGVAFVSTANTSGVWRQVDENGDDAL